MQKYTLPPTCRWLSIWKALETWSPFCLCNFLIYFAVYKGIIYSYSSVLCSFFTIPPSISPLHPILLQHYHCDAAPSSPLPLPLTSHHLSFFSTCSLSPHLFLQSPSFIAQLSPFPPHDSLSLSNTQPLYLSHVSCELQSHVSRVSSASNRAGQLCLVLLTDRNTHTQTHTSQQSPVWDYTPGHTLASPYFQGRDRNAYTNAQIKMHINIHNSRTNPVTHTQGHRIYNAVFLIEHN